jgi:hypothetical protein
VNQQSPAFVHKRLAENRASIAATKAAMTREMEAGNERITASAKMILRDAKE